MSHQRSSLLSTASLALILGGIAQASPVYNYSYFTVGGALVGTSSTVTGINNAGDVTGYYFDTSNHADGFLLKANGTLTAIAPGNTFHNVEAFGVNNSDTVSGWNDIVYNANNNSTYEGFIETANGSVAYADLSSPYRTYGYGINDSGVMVGYYSTSYGNYGYTYNGTTVTALNDPGTPGDTFAFGINNSGQIVGYYLIGGVQHGFLRNTDGTYVNIDAPGAAHGTDPQAINSQGDIAGYYLDGVNKVHGFVYLASDHSFETIDLGAGRNYVYGINDSDQISGAFQQGSIGNYTDFIGTAAPTSATPEPAGYLLLAGGMAFIAVIRRRM
jgi:hypothetical protein